MNASALAVIADVHGNALALEAVLADIARRGLRRIVNLGDNANGPLEPALSVALLRGCTDLHVRGNGDRMTAEGGPTARKSALHARERLDAGALRWLRELPFTLQGDGWLAFHATPRSDEEYFLEIATGGRTELASPGNIAGSLGFTDASLILCGHTHIPRLVRLPDGRTIVNPGSVGLPAYEDNHPVPHRVENHRPDARYAVATRRGAHWEVELASVPYDHRAAAALARAAGWEAWARYVETGRC